MSTLGSSKSKHCWQTLTLNAAIGVCTTDFVKILLFSYISLMSFALKLTTLQDDLLLAACVFFT